MSFKIEDDDIFSKYNAIWNKNKITLNIKFHTQCIYEEQYITTKVKTFNDVINTVFSDNKTPKERNYCTCIAAINIDCYENRYKNYPEVYLEQFKYRENKRRLVDFIDVELNLD